MVLVYKSLIIQKLVQRICGTDIFKLNASILSKYTSYEHGLFDVEQGESSVSVVCAA